MNWTPHTNMIDAINNAIPKGAAQDAGFSTPDIYGRASQLYLSLRKTQGASKQNSDEIRLWRGLLMLVALYHHQNLPLQWEAVEVKAGDTVSDALRNPKFEREDLLFDPKNPREKDYMWNGRNFYVLTWGLENGKTRDIAVYSPQTLLYPVADWENILKEIADHHVFFKRIFDSETMTFRSCDVLRDDEKSFVDLWLDKMIDTIRGTEKSGEELSSAARAVIQHLKSFKSDLNVLSISGFGQNLRYEPFDTGIGDLSGAVPEALYTAFRHPDGQIFSDQICIFRVLKKEGNPFSDRGCQYADKYEIKDAPDRDCNWYAFLPIHPERRSTCITDGIAKSVSMRYRYDRETRCENICVSMELPGTSPVVRDYPVVNEKSDKKGQAFFYIDREKGLDMDTWPLLAVWPAAIGKGWKEYYVARGEKPDQGVRIFGEPGTGWSDGGDAPVKLGSNRLAVKTAYVPDAIPLVRMMPKSGGGETAVSIGIVTPKMRSAVGVKISADVAVDFGTSSSRVYYQLTGSPAVNELFVQKDEPLEVTAYTIRNKDSSKLNINKAHRLSEAFVSPTDPDAAQGKASNPLFSMFLRSADEKRPELPPILEGVIYQPTPRDDLEMMEHLITDVKWDDANGIYFAPFMQQLCLHVSAMLYQKHHVNHIIWHYALPKALEYTKQDRMMKIWQEDIKLFLDKASGGGAGAGSITHEVLPPITESVAASMYFNENGQGYVQPERGYLVVDIGGGSTDVALWQSSFGEQTPELKWHSSIKVAGRHMFTKQLEERIGKMAGGIVDPDLQFLLENWREAWGKKSDDNAAKASTAYADRLLSTYGRELRKQYETVYDNNQARWAAEMRGQILRSVSLLMFSLGYQVGLEMDDGTMTKPTAPGYFAICVGGRGSNILDWLMLDQTRNYPQLREFFKMGVAASMGKNGGWPDDVQIKIQKSPSPKCEVAMGLLAQKTKDIPGGGWDFQASQNDMQNTNYAVDAAELFVKGYNRIFPDPELSITGQNSSLVKGREKEVDTARLAGAVEAMRGRKLRDNAFQVLMESIHEML